MKLRSVAALHFASFDYSWTFLSAAEVNADSDLREFKSQKQGYTLLVPSSWEQKEKAGKRSAFYAKSAMHLNIIPSRASILRLICCA